jgi:drug/metabolite transporter (DMT)-like permease
MEREKKIFGILFIVILMWGLNVVMVKYLVQSGEPLQLAAFRITAASILLVPLVFWQTGWKSFKLHKKAIWPTIALGIMSIYIHQLCLSYGLLEAQAGTSGLILGLNPLTTSLLSVLILKEVFNFKRGLGILIGFLGVLLVVFNSSNGTSFSFNIGEWLILAAMFTYVIGTLFAKIASQYSTVLVMTAYSHLLASILLLLTWTGIKPAEAAWLLPIESMTFLGIFLLSGLGSTALCTLWWNNSIHVIGPSRTSMFLNGLPLASLLSAAVFLDEQIQWIHFFAFLCIVLGVYLGTKKPTLPLAALDKPIDKPSWGSTPQ